MSSFELVSLKRGGHSLRSLKNMETFHPLIGPAEEARILHISSQKIRERMSASNEFHVWDVGFGAAANAIAVAGELKHFCGERAEIHSFDTTTAPIEFALAHAKDLVYLVGFEELLKQLLRSGVVKINPTVTWLLHVGDFRDTLHLPQLPSPHSILYDPYSPVHNPELWTLEHFENLYGTLDPAVPMLLTNYTRSTAMRVAMLLSGFCVGRGCAIGEKVETTVASNRLELISDPLDLNWLNRVRASGNASPLFKGLPYSQKPITPELFQRLLGCRQFQR